MGWTKNFHTLELTRVIFGEIIYYSKYNKIKLYKIFCVILGILHRTHFFIFFIFQNSHSISYFSYLKGCCSFLIFVNQSHLERWRLILLSMWFDKFHYYFFGLHEFTTHHFVYRLLKKGSRSGHKHGI